MNYRPKAIKITPVHNSGYYAPAIYVNADNYLQAKQEAAKKCFLFITYPKIWRLI